MAAVYLAQDLRHDRPVALKVLHPELALSLGPERFQREIRFAARLQHPHILTVLDSGDAAGQLWFTMPFVEGESLRDRLRREHQLPVEAALRVADEAARALEYAHQHGVVHRDIKPENILLAKDGSTLVADFGIARALAGSDEKLTETGMVVGTVAYMSPEQASGETVDARTDIYALGAVVYEMLAGEPPFTGPTAQAIMVKRVTQPVPSLRTARPNVSAGVDQAVHRALAPMAADRFATAAELARALHATAPHTTASEVTTAATRVTASSPARHLKLPGVAIALIAGLLIGGGLLFAWRRTAGSGEPPSGARVVAVLPFDNLGDSADAYFADGVSDEVRTRLGQVAGIEVIARGSSLEYRHTTKRATEIAHDLGADYLLTGTVRWEKSGGTSRVRVTPELVEARRGQAARSRWGRQFDASLTDVFQVQGDIAAQVADALGLALADSASRGLAARPTESLDAYDLFLKGEAALTTGGVFGLRQAVRFYERAVALDPAFATAWARLSSARSAMVANGARDPELATRARAAGERARALRPDAPETALAVGYYYAVTDPIDNERSLAEYQHGLRMAPDNVQLLTAVAGGEIQLGRRPDSAIARLTRASVLDPRSAVAMRQLAMARFFLGQYAAADSAADRAVALAPASVYVRYALVLIRLGRGDLEGARSAIRSGEAHVDAGVLLPSFAGGEDLYWVLDDDQQRRVLAMPPSAFDDDRGIWATVRMYLYQLRHDSARMSVYADSARLVLEEQLRANPSDAVRHAYLGVVLAHLGRKDDAVREGRRAAELIPVSRGYPGYYMRHQLVRIYILVGEPERALDELEALLRLPYYVTPAWLRIDPAFSPLKGNPRFEKLLAGS
jgi:TolB-like protein/tRNA A-37 threonylcarbamoyl transferase component Bud32/Flp pilus assembly protein TadD